MDIELREQLDIIVSGAKEETVVNMTLLGSDSKLLFQSLECSGLGDGVGHIEIGGDTTCSSRLRLGVDIGLVGETGFPEVDMVVDDTRKHETTRSVDDFVIRCFGRMVSLYDLRDSLAVNDQ